MNSPGSTNENLAERKSVHTFKWGITFFLLLSILWESKTGKGKWICRNNILISNAPFSPNNTLTKTFWLLLECNKWNCWNHNCWKPVIDSIYLLYKSCTNKEILSTVHTGTLLVLVHTVGTVEDNKNAEWIIKLLPFQPQVNIPGSIFRWVL